MIYVFGKVFIHTMLLQTTISLAKYFHLSNELLLKALTTLRRTKILNHLREVKMSIITLSDNMNSSEKSHKSQSCVFYL